MTRSTILTVVGARPQFVKAAAVSRALRADGRFTEFLVHTGQHFDAMMSDVFFRELGIPEPAEHLAIAGGSHGAMTGRMLEAVETCIQERRPDWVLVYGDTNSTLAGALAAAKLHVPVIHVEAGLRSFNRRMPEETNRVLTDHVSTLLFSPTQTGIRNLAAEGITAGVHHSGDVMYDAFLHARERARDASPVLDGLALREGSYALATLHRAENTQDADSLRTAFERLEQAAGPLPVVMPLHPRTRQAIARFGVTARGLRLIDPVGYHDMVRLLDGAALVVTDSGGLQKEAYFARRPCVTLRDETEWPETVEHGWNRLWSSPGWLPRREIADYGTGDAAERIVAEIARS